MRTASSAARGVAAEQRDDGGESGQAARAGRGRARLRTRRVADAEELGDGGAHGSHGGRSCSIIVYGTLASPKCCLIVDCLVLRSKKYGFYYSRRSQA